MSCRRSRETGCLNREPRRTFRAFAVPSRTSFFAGLVFAVFFLTAALGLKNIHIKESAFLIGLSAWDERDQKKKMKFENDFRFHLNRIFFYLLFTTFRCHPLRNKPSDHRIMQYKVYDISLSCHSVKRRENPKVAIFICSLYERSSILSVTTLICSFLV